MAAYALSGPAWDVSLLSPRHSGTCESRWRSDREYDLGGGVAWVVSCPCLCRSQGRYYFLNQIAGWRIRQRQYSWEADGAGFDHARRGKVMFGRESRRARPPSAGASDQKPDTTLSLFGGRARRHRPGCTLPSFG